MRALVGAEMLKLRSTRTTVWLLLATLAMACLTVAVSVPKAGDDRAPVALNDPSLLAVTVGGAFGVPMVLMVLLGGVAFTQEFRYGTVTSTYLVEPQRTRVLVAKWLSLVLVSLVVTTLTLVVSVAFSLALIASRDGAVSLDSRFWQMMAGGFVVMAVYGVIGVAIGALVRNQITAVTGVLVWMLAVEHIVFPSYPVVGRWLPTSATYSLMQLDPSVDPDGELLSTSASGVLLAAYAVVAVTLALRLTPKRDVL
jgi:ABC-2 type transport system permease protein